MRKPVTGFRSEHPHCGGELYGHRLVAEREALRRPAIAGRPMSGDDYCDYPDAGNDAPAIGAVGLNTSSRPTTE